MAWKVDSNGTVYIDSVQRGRSELLLADDAPGSESLGCFGILMAIAVASLLIVGSCGQSGKMASSRFQKRTSVELRDGDGNAVVVPLDERTICILLASFDQKSEVFKAHLNEVLQNEGFVFSPLMMYPSHRLTMSEVQRRVDVEPDWSRLAMIHQVHRQSGLAIRAMKEPRIIAVFTDELQEYANVACSIVGKERAKERAVVLRRERGRFTLIDPSFTADWPGEVYFLPPDYKLSPDEGLAQIYNPFSGRFDAGLHYIGAVVDASPFELADMPEFYEPAQSVDYLFCHASRNNDYAIDRLAYDQIKARRGTAFTGWYRVIRFGPGPRWNETLP